MLKPWKTLRSQYLLQDKWITLRADVCETAGGVRIEPYYVLEYADWVNVVAVNQQAEVLVIRLYRHAIGECVYELPCGVMEHGEAPEATARRELREETGVTAKSFELVSSMNPNSATHTNSVHCFLARNAAVTAEPSPEDTEEITFEFLPVHTVMDMIDRGEFRQAQHVASLMVGLRRAGLIKCPS